MEEEKVICYVTDIEGNYEYFKKWLGLVKRYMDFTNPDESELEFKSNNSIFVFGGDICDKGPGSIQLVRLFCSFKKRYRDRVFFILGNRDINKIRFTSELDDPEEFNPQRLNKLECPYFVPKQQRITPKQYLIEIYKKNHQNDPSELTPSILDGHNNQVNRLKWLLNYTMGSAGDFERRKYEISLLKKVPILDITDEEVVESYLSWVREGGELREYLQLGQLGLIIGPTLFVHGGVTTVNYGYVPGESERFEKPEEWISKLNSWCEKEIQDWIAHPKWKDEVHRGRFQPIEKNDKKEINFNGDWSSRGGNRIIAYCAPDSEPTVIYSTMFTKTSSCKLLNTELQNKLIQYGIKRIIVGHTPHGNSPSIMKSEIEVIDADTSYSDMQAPDNRGQAYSAVLLKPFYTKVKGFLNPCEKIEFYTSIMADKNSILPNNKYPDNYVGKEILFGGSSWWVKSVLKNKENNKKDIYVLSKVEGHRVFYHHRSPEELQKYLDINNNLSSSFQLASTFYASSEIKIHGKKVTLKYLINIPVNIEDFKKNPSFCEWLNKVQNEKRFHIKEIILDSLELFGPKISLSKISVLTENEEKVALPPTTIILRGSMVSVLIIQKVPNEPEYTLLFEIPRTTTADYSSIEIPSSFSEDSLTNIKTAKELLQQKVFSDREENVSSLVDLTEFFYDARKSIYVNPGITDEHMTYYLFQVSKTPQQIEGLKSRNDPKLPKIIVELYEDLLKKSPDAKSWAACHLYNYWKEHHIPH